MGTQDGINNLLHENCWRINIPAAYHGIIVRDGEVEIARQPYEFFPGKNIIMFLPQTK